MDFTIDNTIIEKYPNIKIGLLIAKNINNQGNDETLNKIAHQIENEVREKLDLQSLVEHPKINDWRSAYSAFGSKPKTYKNSVEALLRRVLKNEALPNINKIVNIYNMMSIKHMLPAGGDNIDKIDGDITLTIAKGDETFTMLGSDESESPSEGEVIYKDSNEVLCRRWNWRECNKSKMEETTTNVCLVLEGLESTTKEEIKEALEELQEHVAKFCEGELETVILDKENQSYNIN